MEIIDTPQPVQKYLPRLGDIHTIIRYITSRSPTSAKHIKVAEAKSIKGAGKQLGIVHEVWGDFAHAGHGGVSAPDGAFDGPYAVKALKKLGAPEGAGCYFAVDTDPSSDQLRKNVLPYFKAVSQAFEGSGFRVGVYGPGAVCQSVIDAGYADLGWLSNAKGWKGYKAFLPKAHLVQKIPTHIAGGLDVDPNVAQQDDWGQFEPFSEETLSGAVTGAVTGAISEAVSETVQETATDTIADKGKSLFKSKIAWFTGALGGSGVVGWLHSPYFWGALVCLALAALVIYFRWKDHGRGQST